jgi:signal transduction histidine kinase
VFEFESIRRAGLVGKLRAALRGKGFELLGRRFRSEWGRELVLSARCVPLRERGQVREVLISCWDMSAIAAEYDNLMKRTEKVTLGRLAAGAVHEIMSPAKAAEYASQEIARGLTNLIAAERHILVTRLSKETVDLLRDAANAVLPWLARGAPPLPLPQDAEIEKTTSLLAQPGLRLNRPEASVLTRAGLSAHVHRLLAVCRTRVARQRLIAYLVNLARIAHATNVMVHSLPRIQRLAKALEAHAFVESAEWQLAELHQTIDAAIVILHPDLQQVDTDLERRYSSRLGKVKCVPGQLIQMWRNLVGNSLNAIRKSRRRGHIRVTTRRRGNAAFVTIRDNGIGIPPEVEVKAMGTSLPDIAGGKTAGYGLWIVREILERHGGRLCVRRLPGGASITVLLPAEEQSART